MNDKVPCSSTKLIRGGTAYSSSPFELNLQLHGQVSNPYSFGIKQNYKSHSEVSYNLKYSLLIGDSGSGDFGVWNNGSFHTPPVYVFGDITPDTYETNGYIKGIFVRTWDGQFRVETLGYTYSNSQVMVAKLLIDGVLYTYELPNAGSGRSPAYHDFAVYGGDLLEHFKNNINKIIKVDLEIK